MKRILLLVATNVAILLVLRIAGSPPSLQSRQLTAVLHAGSGAAPSWAC